MMRDKKMASEGKEFPLCVVLYLKVFFSSLRGVFWVLKNVARSCVWKFAEYSVFMRRSRFSEFNRT